MLKKGGAVRLSGQLFHLESLRLHMFRRIMQKYARIGLLFCSLAGNQKNENSQNMLNKWANNTLKERRI